MSINVDDSDAKYMHNYVKELGAFSRSPGSSGERKGAELTAEHMKKFSDDVKIEDFQLAPKAALGWIKLFVPLFFIALITFYLVPILSAILMAFNLFIAVGEFVFYKKVIDPFLPKKRSQNTYSIINPSQDTRQTIIFSGHVDSPFQFNFIKWWGGRIYAILVFGAIVIFLLFGILSILNAILITIDLFIPGYMIRYTTHVIFFIIWIIFWCLSPIGALFFLFTTWVETPGCGDNLSAVSVALGVGNSLKKAKETGGFFPEHTKVIIMAFGSEESFLRGAMAYAKAHKDELLGENAIVINMEVIVEPDNFYAITRDLNGTVGLSKKVVNDIIKVSKELGFNVRKLAAPLGAGSSDSAALAREGIETTCIFGINIGKIIRGKGYFNNYHTVRDTPDKVDPKALEQVLSICLHYLKTKDEEISV
ncbi:MAG: M28 family peptidase [Candidatus Lokiarchaeota archaeon]|nr:M28 family peptidase [Candidatus Lokiarchaeota archaeon]